MEERDYILHKALALRAKTELEQNLQRLDKICELYAEKIGVIDKNLSNSATLCDVAKFSKKLDNVKTGFLSLLAIKNRAKMLLSRNNERIELLTKMLSDSGIYKETYDKKEFNKIANSEEFLEEEIGLNCYADGGIVYKYIDGYLFAFRGNLLDMSLDFNKEQLSSLDSAMIRKLFGIYPNFVSTMPIDLWMNVGLKQRVLKELAGYVSEELNTKSISGINKNLGSLLSFKSEITENVSSYVAGVQNMIDVLSKNEATKLHPEKITEIQQKLKCNEKSELIPKSKRGAALANGMAGDVVEDENEQSEDVRVKKEKELQDIQNLQMLSDFLNIDFDLNEFAEANEESKETEKQNDENAKHENEKIKEQRSENKANEAIEEYSEMSLSYSKHKD